MAGTTVDPMAEAKAEAPKVEADAGSAARVREVLAEATPIPTVLGTRRGELPWFRRWDRVFVHEPPTFRWFEGGADEPGVQLPRSPGGRRSGGRRPR